MHCIIWMVETPKDNLKYLVLLVFGLENTMSMTQLVD